MFEGKRKSFGTATYFLDRHSLTMRRYLREFYPRYDWGIVKRFFYDNPIQAMHILDDYRKSNEAKLREVIYLFLEGKSKIVFIVGARGSGKTATAFMFAEEVNRETNRPIFYVSSLIKQELLPRWMKVCKVVSDVPKGCFAIIDESAIQFSSRDFMQKDSKDMSKELKIARHKDLFLIFITQHIASTDIEIERMKDLVLWKMSNDYGFGVRDKRTKQGKFWDKVRNMMAPRRKEEVLFEYPAKKRFINFKHGLPECWSDALSKTWRDAQISKMNEKKIKEKGGNDIKFRAK